MTRHQLLVALRAHMMSRPHVATFPGDLLPVFTLYLCHVVDEFWPQYAIAFRAMLAEDFGTYNITRYAAGSLETFMHVRALDADGEGPVAPELQSLMERTFTEDADGKLARRLAYVEARLTMADAEMEAWL